MSEFIFILGGARSGKSAYALNLAKEKSRKVLYIATAEAGDSEMKSRISKHKASRPRYWEKPDLQAQGLQAALLEDHRGAFGSDRRLKEA